MIEVKNLTKNYGGVKAVNDITFTVNKGEIVGFLGPNGAGKSTTMNILTGYLSASSGNVSIDGFDVLENPNDAKRRIGYLPELPPLYQDMTVQEYLEFMYELKQVNMPKQAHIKEICNLVKISHVYKRIIRNLSKGYKQRVGIAQALLGNPPVLILDEPTVGLDPNQIIEIRNLIRQLGEKHTVILSSHILSEVQAVCERVIIIDKGELVADGTPDQLSADLTQDHRLIARIMGPNDEVEKLLKKLPNIVTVVNLGEKEPATFEYAIETEQNYDVRRELFTRLCERNWALVGLRSTDLTLEEVFLQLTQQQGNKFSKNKKTGGAK